MTQLKKTQRASADQTRSIMLQVSRELFSKKGFSGTSIGDIAKAAGINQSLIYHHFEDKIGLWKAVKTQIVDEYMQKQEAKDIALQSLREYIEALVRLRIDIFHKNPDMLRMMNWQDLEPNAGTLMSLNVACCYNWVADVQRLQQLGKMTTQYDAHLIVTMIASVCKGAHRDGPGVEFNIQEQARQEQYIMMLVDMLVTGLEPSIKKL